MRAKETGHNMTHGSKNRQCKQHSSRLNICRFSTGLHVTATIFSCLVSLICNSAKTDMPKLQANNYKRRFNSWKPCQLMV